MELVSITGRLVLGRRQTLTIGGRFTILLIPLAIADIVLPTVGYWGGSFPRDGGLRAVVKADPADIVVS